MDDLIRACFSKMSLWSSPSVNIFLVTSTIPYRYCKSPNFVYLFNFAAVLALDFFKFKIFLGAGSAVHPQQAASPPGHQAGEHLHLSRVPHPLPAQEVSFFYIFVLIVHCTVIWEPSWCTVGCNYPWIPYFLLFLVKFLQFLCKFILRFIY